MANLRNVVYISNEDYETLVSTGTVTIGGVTITYNENDLYLTPDGKYVLNSSSSTSTGALPYIESTTSKYLHSSSKSISLTEVSTGLSTPSTDDVASKTHTHTVTANGSVSLAVNDATADGRITYVQSVTGGSASGTGSGTAAPNEHTHSYNTYELEGTNASGSLRYMKFTAGTAPPTTATPSHSNVSTSNGSGTAVKAVTGYSSFSGGLSSGNMYATRTTSGSGTSARRTLEYSHTHSHTAASLGTADTSDAAPHAHTHNYDKTTSVALSGGTAPSMNFNTGVTTDTPYVYGITNGTISLKTNTDAGTTGKNSGSAVNIIGGVSYTAPTVTTKYLSAAFSGSSATTGGPSNTLNVVTGVSSSGSVKALTTTDTETTLSILTDVTVDATPTSAISTLLTESTTKYLSLSEEE